MDFMDVIRTRRTIRFFDQKPLSRQLLLDFLDCARLAPSGSNNQPLEFILVDDKSTSDKLFPFLAWAGFVQPKRNPPQGKQPVAYIVVVSNHQISPASSCGLDSAAAIENIILAAWSKGVGSCWMGAIQRDDIKQLLNIPQDLHVQSVVALGYPAENPILEQASDSTKYYLDQDDNLHVPKHPLNKIVFQNAYGRGL